MAEALLLRERETETETEREKPHYSGHLIHKVKGQQLRKYPPFSDCPNQRASFGIHAGPYRGVPL